MHPHWHIFWTSVCYKDLPVFISCHFILGRSDCGPRWRTSGLRELLPLAEGREQPPASAIKYSRWFDPPAWIETFFWVGHKVLAGNKWLAFESAEGMAPAPAEDSGVGNSVDDPSTPETTSDWGRRPSRFHMFRINLLTVILCMCLNIWTKTRTSRETPFQAPMCNLYQSLILHVLGVHPTSRFMIYYRIIWLNIL